jgi:hypothetical protein
LAGIPLGPGFGTGGFGTESDMLFESAQGTRVDRGGFRKPVLVLTPGNYKTKPDPSPQ